MPYFGTRHVNPRLMKNASFFSTFLLLLSVTISGHAQLMRPADLAVLPVDPPDRRLAYGADSLQYGELRLPAGAGPHPVVVIIHGGCWLNAYDLHLMDPMATALTRAGYATWNLEYRRIGDAGGGWPGTFHDVAIGLNHLRQLASEYALDLGRVVVTGHSAGGHLALWLAGQRRLPAASKLRPGEPLAVAGVVSLAGIVDPATYLVREGQGCGTAVDELLGGWPEDLPGRYQEASPMALAPLGVPQVLITGTEDRIVPLTHVRPYSEKAAGAGDSLRFVEVARAGHFEVIAPGSVAWEAVMEAVGSFW